LPPYRPLHNLDPDKPVNINPVVMADPMKDPDGVLCPGYMGFRHRLQETMESALPQIARHGKLFGEAFGRSYEDCLYRYRAEDAEFLFVTMGSLASEASETVDILRERGIKAGVIGVRVYRPFPAAALAEAASKAQGVAVIEKAISYGYEGPLATEFKAAFFGRNAHQPVVYNYVASLGGTNIKPTDLIGLAEETMDAVGKNSRQGTPRWLNYGV
jgi:pyruvate/2-oxoacid:ferredoxin oxidoreductase alpha subunit